MKRITAIIKPHMLDRLASTMRKSQIAGITVMAAQGFGRDEIEADVELIGYLSERTVVEMIVADDRVDEIVKLIQKTVSTKHSGDGVVFVSSLDSAIRLSDGQDIGSPHQDDI